MVYHGHNPRAERSSCSPVEKAALRIVVIVGHIEEVITPDVEITYIREIWYLVDLLNGRVTSADAARVVKICAGIPLRLKRCRHEEVATVVQEMLDVFKNWPPDEMLVSGMNFGELEPLDEFEVVETDKLWLGYFEVKGRFLRLDASSLKAIGLKGSSHAGKIVSFNTHFTKVRKVIKHQGR